MQESEVRTVLLIDDSPVSRQVIQIYLDGLPYRFVEATDAQKGLALAASTRVDLIIVDFNMPGMNGVAFVEKLRAHANEDVRHVPVILLSGDRSTTLAERSRAAGVTAYLKKPVSAGGLMDVVKTLFPVTRSESGTYRLLQGK